MEVFGRIQKIYRYLNISVWAKAGHFSQALSKGPKTTTWICNLHADAHDFTSSSQDSKRLSIRRKVLSSNVAHLSLLFFWIPGMLYHGAYLSNYMNWLKDPGDYFPSAHLVWTDIGIAQHILNSDTFSPYQGIIITSGIFNIWRSSGIISSIHLKYGCLASLIGTPSSLAPSYFHSHISAALANYHTTYHHYTLFFGLSSISWCGHLIHISTPLNKMLDSGIDPVFIPCPQDLLFQDLIEIYLPGFSIRPLVNSSTFFVSQ